MKNPTLPPFDYQPKKYAGPSAGEVLAQRKQFMNPGIFLYYKKPIMFVEGKMQYIWYDQGKRYLDGLGGIVTIASGMAMYSADPARMLANPAFGFKIAALLAALVNAWWFHAVLTRRISQWDTTDTLPVAVQASGYVSFGLWIALIVAGRLIAFI